MYYHAVQLICLGHITLHKYPVIIHHHFLTSCDFFISFLYFGVFIAFDQVFKVNVAVRMDPCKE